MTCYYMMFLSKMEVVYLFFFFKQKTEYEMRISDWSSDVCSSDLPAMNDAKGMIIAMTTVVLWLLLTFPQAPEGESQVEYSVAGRIEIGRASCRERVCQYV